MENKGFRVKLGNCDSYTGKKGNDRLIYTQKKLWFVIANTGELCILMRKYLERTQKGCMGKNRVLLHYSIVGRGLDAGKRSKDPGIIHPTITQKRQIYFYPGGGEGGGRGVFQLGKFSQCSPQVDL